MGVQASSADYASSRISYSYRLQGAREWKLLGDYDVLSKTGFNPFAVDPATNSAIGLKRIGGREVLVRLSLDGTGREETLFAHPRVDVTAPVRIGRRGRVVGVSYATDKREAAYFDSELVRIASSLTKALPACR